MNQGFSISDLFAFEKMIAPKVLKVVYWIGLFGILLFGLVSFAGAISMFQYSGATALGTMVAALIGTAVAVLFWRILIEVYMIFFSMNERLGDIRNSLAGKDSLS